MTVAVALDRSVGCPVELCRGCRFDIRPVVDVHTVEGINCHLHQGGVCVVGHHDVDEDDSSQQSSPVLLRTQLFEEGECGNAESHHLREQHDDHLAQDGSWDLGSDRQKAVQHEWCADGDRTPHRICTVHAA